MLIELFKVFLMIGLVSIGGGYAIIPTIQKQIVEICGWLSLGEYTDIITISQMTPGPIAVNTSTFVGMRIYGLPGAIVATVGCVLAGCIISVLFYKFYYALRENIIMKQVVAGLQASSLGLIASSCVLLICLAIFGTMTPIFSELSVNVIAIGIAIVSYFFLSIKKKNPILIILLAGVAGIFIYG